MIGILVLLLSVQPAPCFEYDYEGSIQPSGLSNSDTIAPSALVETTTAVPPSKDQTTDSVLKDSLLPSATSSTRSTTFATTTAVADEETTVGIRVCPGLEERLHTLFERYEEFVEAKRNCSELFPDPERQLEKIELFGGFQMHEEYWRFIILIAVLANFVLLSTSLAVKVFSCCACRSNSE